MPKNFIQTTSFMQVPLSRFEAAVEFFRDLLGFQEYIHVRDYAYLEREECGIAISGTTSMCAMSMRFMRS